MGTKGTFVGGLAVAVGLLGGGCGGTSAPDVECNEATPIDIAGTFTERYNCAENDLCVDEDVSFEIEIHSPLENEDGSMSYSMQDTLQLGWTGEGTLCGYVYTWTASTDVYVESGTWVFSDADNFEKASSYDYVGGHGSCTGYGTRTGTPPAPPPIGNCP